MSENGRGDRIKDSLGGHCERRKGKMAGGTGNFYAKIKEILFLVFFTIH